MIDSYQAEIDRLTRLFEEKGSDAFDGEVDRSWGNFMDHGYLFCDCAKRREASYPFGCLTQVKSGRFQAETPELTAAIRADSRIPHAPNLITSPSQLAVFREWQLRIDRELGRETPMVEA